MKFTDKHKSELSDLLEIQQSTQPLLDAQFNRILELKSLFDHNKCFNPECSGYEADEEDYRYCVFCGSALYKHNPEMNITHFDVIWINFLKHFYPKHWNDFPHVEMMAIGYDFIINLAKKLRRKPGAYESMVPHSPRRVIMDSVDPLKMNGYHPGLILHFTEYLKEKSEEIQVQ